MHVAAIIAAGGLGTRLGSGRPKQFLDLGDGRMMLARSLATFARCPLVHEIVVALPPGDESVAAEQPTPGKPLAYVRGGARRQDSVGNALARVSAAADIVVIHDAARPFVSVDLIERTVRAAATHGAAIAAIAVTDTVKQAEAADRRIVRATLPRDTIFLAQTPQAFRREVLAGAMAAAGDVSVTDEAALVERAGLPVYLVEGDPANLKVTTADDWARARARVQAMDAPPAAMRIGTGYDLHRLVEGRPLILAGVHVPFDRGLLGHSDADIACHAVTDAILGAAAIGDIGRLYPDTDPRWKDADSVRLLADAAALVRRAGYAIVNVDVTVIAERPKLAPHLEAMRGNLAAALGIAPGAVSIKGKTNEGVGEVGRGEAMACHAVALVQTA